MAAVLPGPAVSPGTCRPSGYWRRGILRRTALSTWGVVLVALSLFTGLVLTYQHRVLVDQLSSTAQIVATSIGQATVTSVVVEDYTPVIEHCLNVLRDRPMVRYLVLQRRDGFALVLRAGAWRAERLDDRWTAPRFLRGDFADSDLVEEKVFHYSYPLSYSGIDWGWIHVGLSLDEYRAERRVLYTRTLLVALLCLLVASVVSLWVARRMSRPIEELNRLTQRVASGDLTARVDIATGDELQSLAHSLNQMTQALGKARDELEIRVEERTTELRVANERLLAEIKERHRAEEARSAAEQRLKEHRVLRMRSDRLRSLGEMAAGIAHELNQPLTVVRGTAELLLLSQEPAWKLDDDSREQLRAIVGQVERMAHIVEHVRRFAREAGQPQLVEVQVNDVVRSALSLVRAQFRFRGLHLEADLADGLPRVRANPFSLEEVLLNLVANARDAVEEKAVRLGQWQGQAQVRTLASDHGVRIEVADNGAGIPPERQAQVFDPFYTTKSPEHGTGLGLAISRAIIEECGGRLWLTSVPGEGTTVVVDLPAAAPDAAPGAQA